MEKTLTVQSKQPCADSLPIVDSLIREWVAKLAINAGASLDAKAQAVFCSVWLEGLGDLPPAVLLAAFRKTLRECAYWPVKVADIRKHVAHAVSHATDEAAEEAWRRVLEIRRVHWNPDIPGPFDRAVARLSPRVKQAARAAGVWRDFTADEWESGALHTWAKKRFFESFNAWGDRKQDEYLLPEGEVGKLLIECAETKALLPAPKQETNSLAEAEEKIRSLECRLRVAEQVAEAARKVIAANLEPKPIQDTAERRAELAYQAKFIIKNYPQKEATA